MQLAAVGAAQISNYSRLWSWMRRTRKKKWASAINIIDCCKRTVNSLQTMTMTMMLREMMTMMRIRLQACWILGARLGSPRVIFNAIFPRARIWSRLMHRGYRRTTMRTIIWTPRMLTWKTWLVSSGKISRLGRRYSLNPRNLVVRTVVNRARFIG